MERHNCGGVLVSALVSFRTQRGGLLFLPIVPGFRCMQCAEELISRDTAAALEKSAAWQPGAEEYGDPVLSCGVPAVFLSPTGFSTTSNLPEPQTVGTAEYASVG